jgi:hyperosmotically inducible periplasmic protein
MYFARTTICLALAACVSGGAVLVSGQEPASPPDNTKINQRDRDKSQPTADQQKENRSDRDITQQIRKAIVKDKSLSTDAHNIKVVTQNGAVTLKGPVHSEEEKKAVEAKAAEVAGQDKVTNQLEVKSSNQ